MEQPLVGVAAQPCVWMCAGLVSYRLCTRDFDCEHCPLDAALRGELPTIPEGSALLYRPEAGQSLPADRLYSTGHTWARRVADRGDTWRIGIDAFAATLVGNAQSISCEPFEHVHAREPLCTIDMGVGQLHIGAPFSGRVMHHNDALHTLPGLLVTHPYSDGWIAELLADEPPAAGLLSAGTARQQLALDVRRFRRTIAFRLLAATESGELGDCAVEELGDLRTVIAGDRYAECIRDFVH